MKEEPPKKRKRDVAHLWADKRAVRFFRKNFDKTHYKNLRSVYLALCEIDSDFREKSQINNFAKTVATYSGMGEETVGPYLRAFQKADIIDYEQLKVDGRFAGTSLSLYAWDEHGEEESKERIIKVLENKMKRTKNPEFSRSREIPSTGNPVHGKSRPFKNNNKLLGTFKNSKEDLDKKNSSITDDEKNDELIPLKEKHITPSMFEKFWKIYPKKVDKGKAKTKWEGICKKNTKERPTWKEIKAAILRQKKTERWQEKEFIPHPTTWLNQQRWLDDPEEMKSYSNGTHSHNHSHNPVNASAGPGPVEIIQKRFRELAPAFTKTCYTPAKEVINGPDNKIAQELANLYDQIEVVQSKHNTSNLLPGPISLVEYYLEWIEDNDWISDKSIKLLDVHHTLFGRFRREEAKKDNLERDPLTGKSYLKE